MLTKRLTEIAWLLEQAARGESAGGVFLIGLNVKVPRGSTGEATVVIKGVSEEGQKLVAFQSGDTVVMAWLRGLSKWWNCELKWREDEWSK
jgi:hypothetical protein